MSGTGLPLMTPGAQDAHCWELLAAVARFSEGFAPKPLPFHRPNSLAYMSRLCNLRMLNLNG